MHFSNIIEQLGDDVIVSLNRRIDLNYFVFTNFQSKLHSVAKIFLEKTKDPNYERYLNNKKRIKRIKTIISFFINHIKLGYEIGCVKVKFLFDLSSSYIFKK